MLEKHQELLNRMHLSVFGTHSSYLTEREQRTKRRLHLQSKWEAYRASVGVTSPYYSPAPPPPRASKHTRKRRKDGQPTRKSGGRQSQPKPAAKKNNGGLRAMQEGLIETPLPDSMSEMPSMDIHCSHGDDEESGSDRHHYCLDPLPTLEAEPNRFFLSSSTTSAASSHTPLYPATKVAAGCDGDGETSLEYGEEETPVEVTEADVVEETNASQSCSHRADPMQGTDEKKTAKGEEEGLASRPPSSSSYVKAPLRDIQACVRAVGISLTVPSASFRTFQCFTGDPVAYRRQWEMTCRTSRRAFHHAFPTAAAGQSGRTSLLSKRARKILGEDIETHVKYGVGDTLESGRSSSYRSPSNPELRQRYTVQMRSHEQLVDFFSHRNYLSRVWSGVPQRDIEGLLGGSYVIPSTRGIGKDVLSFRRMARREVQLRRVLLRELDDSTGYRGLRQESVAGFAHRDPGAECEAAAAGGGSELLSSELDQDATEATPPAATASSSNLFLEIHLNTDSNHLQLRFSAVTDDIGVEEQTFIGRWTAACVDKWRWIILNGPLRDRIVFFDTEHAMDGTSTDGTRFLRGVSRLNGCSDRCSPASSVVIGAMCFQRCIDTVHNSNMQHLVCAHCGSFCVSSLQILRRMRRCKLCGQNDFIPVAATFQSEKEAFLQVARRAQREGGESGSGGFLSEDLIRQHVRVMMDQARSEVAQRPEWSMAR